jgi:hypothetical protein
LISHDFELNFYSSVTVIQCTPDPSYYAMYVKKYGEIRAKITYSIKKEIGKSFTVKSV